MTGGRAPKAKGYRFEKALVDTFKREIDPSAQRPWGSNGRALGLPEAVDLIFGHDNKVYVVQAKSRNTLPRFLVLPSAVVNTIPAIGLVALKANQEEPLIVIKLRDFINLLKRSTTNG